MRPLVYETSMKVPHGRITSMTAPFRIPIPSRVHFAEVTYKSSPNPACMAEFSALFALLTKAVPNCCVLPQTLTAALKLCDEAGSIKGQTNTFFDEKDFFNQVGWIIRTGWSKYRSPLVDETGLSMQKIIDKSHGISLFTP